MKWTVFTLLACSLPFAFAAEWSQFRGPNTSGTSDAKGLPVTFTEADLAWKVKLPGGGPSSPVFWKDHVYLTVTGEPGTRGVVCLDATSGDQQWHKEYTFKGYQHHKHNSYAASSPCADDQGIYLTWTDAETREVFSLDHAGTERWRVNLGTYYVNHGSGGSPIVVGDVVIVINDVEMEEKDRRFVVGLHRSNGKEVWRHPLKLGGKAGFHTPVLYEPKDGPAQVIVSCLTHGVFAIDPATGKELWTTGSIFSMRTVACPLVADGKLFVTAGSGGGGKESAWITPGTEATKWKPSVNRNLRKSLPYVPSPVSHDGLLYLWGDRAILTAIDMEAYPKEVFAERVGDRMSFYASPVLIDGKLYGVSREGQLVVVAADKEFKLLGTTELGERSDATPAVHGGKLYIRTDSHLLCLPPNKSDS